MSGVHSGHFIMSGVHRGHFIMSGVHRGHFIMSGAQSLAVVVMPRSPPSIQQTGEDEASMTP